MFAFLYNTILIPVAMGFFYPIDGFKLDPMFAATAMAMSSISVVTSSLLLKTYVPKFDMKDVATGKTKGTSKKVHSEEPDTDNSKGHVQLTAVGGSSLQLQTESQRSEAQLDAS